MDSNRLLRRREVETLCGMSQPTIYRLMRQGLFPRPVKIGARAVRWHSQDIDDWVANRPRTAR